VNVGTVAFCDSFKVFWTPCVCVFQAEDEGSFSIRRIRISTGAVTTFAGSVRRGYKDGPAATAKFDDPATFKLNEAMTFAIIVRCR
jgi:hypothetical protein